MKRGTPDHPKTGDLAAALKIQRCTAVGILECLWHFTSRYAPQGNIGKHSDNAIAAACYWPDDRAAELVRALVKTRWFDEHQEHRLVVHDWSEHADDAVHLALARSKKWFADGSVPNMSRLSKDERKRLEEYYAAHAVRTERAQNAPDERTAKPSLAKPSQQHIPASPARVTPENGDVVPGLFPDDHGTADKGQGPVDRLVFKFLRTPRHDGGLGLSDKQCIRAGAMLWKACARCWSPLNLGALLYASDQSADDPIALAVRHVRGKTSGIKNFEPYERRARELIKAFEAQVANEAN